jgi:hypothetical protein
MATLYDEEYSSIPSGGFLSVTWACGAPIEMKIDRGGTEITEKTLKKLKLRAFRVGACPERSRRVVN